MTNASVLLQRQRAAIAKSKTLTKIYNIIDNNIDHPNNAFIPFFINKDGDYKHIIPDANEYVNHKEIRPWNNRRNNFKNIIVNTIEGPANSHNNDENNRQRKAIESEFNKTKIAFMSFLNIIDKQLLSTSQQGSAAYNLLKSIEGQLSGYSISNSSDISNLSSSIQNFLSIAYSNNNTRQMSSVDKEVDAFIKFFETNSFIYDEQLFQKIVGIISKYQTELNKKKTHSITAANQEINERLSAPNTSRRKTKISNVSYGTKGNGGNILSIKTVFDNIGLKVSSRSQAAKDVKEVWNKYFGQNSDLQTANNVSTQAMYQEIRETLSIDSENNPLLMTKLKIQNLNKLSGEIGTKKASALVQALFVMQATYATDGNGNWFQNTVNVYEQVDKIKNATYATDADYFIFLYTNSKNGFGKALSPAAQTEIRQLLDTHTFLNKMQSNVQNYTGYTAEAMAKARIKFRKIQGANNAMEDPTLVANSLSKDGYKKERSFDEVISTGKTVSGLKEYIGIQIKNYVSAHLSNGLLTLSFYGTDTDENAIGGYKSITPEYITPEMANIMGNYIYNKKIFNIKNIDEENIADYVASQSIGTLYRMTPFLNEEIVGHNALFEINGTYYPAFYVYATFFNKYFSQNDYDFITTRTTILEPASMTRYEFLQQYKQSPYNIIENNLKYSLRKMTITVSPSNGFHL